MKFPIIYTTKTSLNLEIRPPKINDANSALEFINALSSEHTFITFQGDQQTLEDEQKYLGGMIKKIEEHECVQLFALDGDKVVANTSIELGIRVNHHVGLFAISVAEGYRDLGLGSILISHLFEYAKSNLPDLKIIELKVFDGNPKAKHVYEKMGFKEFGRLPKGVMYKNELIDEIYMFKEI